MNGLKYIRENVLHLTMEKLADKLGVTKQVIYTWENGKKPISSKRLEQLERKTGIPQRYFVSEELTEREKLEIKQFLIIKHISESTIEYEEEYINSEGKIELVPRVHVDDSAEKALELNKTEIKLCDLQQRIKQIVNDSKNMSDKQLGEDYGVGVMNDRMELLGRFAEIMISPERYKTLSYVIRALEIFYKISEERIWGEENSMKNGMFSEKAELVSEVLRVLRLNRQKEIADLKKQIEETEKLIKLLEE